MKFSPQGIVLNSSPPPFSNSDYDNVDLDSSIDENPFLVDSSPLKAMKASRESPLHHDMPFTPSKTPSYRIKSQRLHQSSPLTRQQSSIHSSPNASMILQNSTELHNNSTSFMSNDYDIDDISSLLEDMKLKEHYEFVQEQTTQHTRSSFRKYLPRNSTARHTRHSSLAGGDFKSSQGPMTSPIRKKAFDVNNLAEPTTANNRDMSEWLDKEKSSLLSSQNSIVSSLEDRLNQRSQQVARKIKQIEEEKRQIAEERKRKEEEERKRREETERKRQEEERQRLEEEAKKKAEEEKKRKEEEAKKAKEEEEQKLKAKQEAELAAKKQKEEEAKKGKGVTNYSSVEAEFVKYKNKIKDIKENIVLKVKENPDLKKIILQHKRKINPKFGQLTNSLQQLSKISNELITMINETKGNELAFHWILNFVCKAIVSQSETEVAVKPNSSIPLAKLTLNLLCEYPEMYSFLMARFIKKCPFVIGYTCDVDTEEGRLRMGWKRHDGSRWEEELTYEERMSGMMTLYCVITRLVLSPTYYQNVAHPLGLKKNWELIVRILNLPKGKLRNVHYIVVSSWWESSAYEVMQNYGIQAKKLLEAVCEDWCNLVEDQKFTGERRLRGIGEDWKSSGKISRFEEMEA